MLETKEFLDMLMGIITQSITSFADGVQVSDTTEFIDDFLAIPDAIKGLKEGFPSEAKSATRHEVEELFKTVASDLINAGLSEMVAGSIESNLKGIYYAVAAVKQSGGDLVPE